MVQRKSIQSPEWVPLNGQKRCHKGLLSAAEEQGYGKPCVSCTEECPLSLPSPLLTRAEAQVCRLKRPFAHSFQTDGDSSCSAVPKPIAKLIAMAKGLSNNGSMFVGYARVSKENGQDTTTQVAALKAAGVERLYEEHASGGRWDRPELHRALDQLRRGDIFYQLSLIRTHEPRCGDRGTYGKANYRA